MDKNSSNVSSYDAGTLGILHLKRFWTMAMSAMQRNNAEKKSSAEGAIDQFVLDGLELDICETVSFLNEKKPTFPGFEEWILAKHDGNIPSNIRKKINRAVTSYLKEEHKTYPLSPQIKDPVFTKEEMDFWEENGYIVLKNAIPLEDCKAAENVIWDFLKMKPEEPNGWHKRSVPFWIRNYQHAIFLKNRKAARIHKAFAQLWGTEELFQPINSLSFNPPIKDEHREYGPSYLHWDDSIAMPMRFDVIGMLYLNDVDENQGAFQCVPGFHRIIESWLASLPEDADPREEIRGGFETVKVAGKAGDLIICRQELPHGSSLNKGDYPRFVQYITMYPPDRRVNPVWK